jgi:DNA polymerase-3 subunit beta
LAELVSSLPQEAASISVEADKLLVVCGRHKATINGISAEEFPEITSLKDTKEKAGILRLKRAVLTDTVGRVSLAAGTDEARPVFTGIKMEFSKNTLRMAATDGYRLGIQQASGLKEVVKVKNLIVPAKALTELVKVMSALEEGDDEVVLAVTDEEKQLILKTGEVEIVTRILEGDFPDFDKIVPASSKTRLELDKEALQSAVRAAAVFAKDSANIVKFKIDDKGLTISANAPQVGENEVGLSGKKTGDNIEVAFNSRYLMEMLAVIDQEKIILEASGPLSPGVFKLPDDPGFLHIIMPVRVQG